MRILSDKIVTAKKTHRCNACETWVDFGASLTDCATNDQRLVVEAAIADKLRILPGQQYRKVVGIGDEGFFTYKARPGMDSVCRALGLYDE